MAAELSRRRTALAGTTRVLLGSLAPTPRRQAGPAHAAARVSGGRGQSGQLPRAGRRAAHAARPYRPRMQQSQRPYRPRMLQGSRPKVAAGPSLAGGTALAIRRTGGCAMRKERLRLVTEEKRGVRLGFRVSGQAPLIYIGRHQLPTVRSDQRSRSLHVRVCGQLGQMG